MWPLSVNYSRAHSIVYGLRSCLEKSFILLEFSVYSTDSYVEVRTNGQVSSEHLLNKSFIDF